jgi:catechol 2,3-dioxygenase-like lactoylglutathione lyase family enzyme
VALRCRDLESLERFYTDLLGYEVEWRPDADSVYLTSGEDNLALHRDPEATRETRLDHLGVLVSTPEAVDDWARFLSARGATLDTRPRTHRDGCRSFYLRDPESNRIQLLFHPGLAKKR